MTEKHIFQNGVTLFNAGKFFEAHEEWEQIWLREREPEKTFLQGLIQVAAAFRHHLRGNRRGVNSLLAAGLLKLEGFPGDHHRGLALASFKAEAQHCASALATGDGLEALRLPRIRLIGDMK